MRNNYCRFCANDIDDNKLIWKDSFQLCDFCYDEYIKCENEYEKNVLLSKKVKELASKLLKM